jgi:hypothetical protein
MTYDYSTYDYSTVRKTFEGGLHHYHPKLLFYTGNCGLLLSLFSIGMQRG